MGRGGNEIANAAALPRQRRDLHTALERSADEVGGTRKRVARLGIEWTETDERTARRLAAAILNRNPAAQRSEEGINQALEDGVAEVIARRCATDSAGYLAHLTKDVLPPRRRHRGLMHRRTWTDPTLNDWRDFIREVGIGLIAISRGEAENWFRKRMDWPRPSRRSPSGPRPSSGQLSDAGRMAIYYGPKG